MKAHKLIIRTIKTTKIMSKIFTVISSNPNSKQGFVTKLQNETVITDSIFGDKTKKETYYISGSKQLTEGMKINDSSLFPKFRVEEHPMVNPVTGEEFKAKWLHLS